MQNHDKYQVVSTKVSNESYMLLKKLCERKGVTMYEFLQMVCDTLIRYMDDRHNLTPEMEQAMTIFDHMEGWKEAYNLCDPTATKDVHEAIYFFSQDGKGGARAVHCELPWMGERVATCNIQEILERTLCLLMPERYKRLRMVAIDRGTTSLLSCLDQLIEEHEKEEDRRAIRRGFEDHRTEYGQQPLDDMRYKQHKARGFDNIADRKRILGEEQELWQSIEDDNQPEDDGTLQGIREADELSQMESDEDGTTD